MKRWFSTILCALLLCPAAILAQEPAAGAPPPDDQVAGWTFFIRPYFFLSGVSGSVTADPLTIPINSDFSELLDNLQPSGFISVTAEKGQWGVYGDFQYIQLAGTGTGRAGTTLELKNLIGEVDVTHRPAGIPTLRFLLGVRVYSVDQTLTISDGEPATANTTVADPILGAIGQWALGEKFDFEVRGDIGGFGIGSEFTSQMSGLFLWRVGEKIRIPFGYRVISYQIRSGDVWLSTNMGGLVLGADFGL